MKRLYKYLFMYFIQNPDHAYLTQMNNRPFIYALKHYELDKIYEKNAILHFIFVKIFLSRDWDEVMVDWMLLISLQMFFS